jgi:hypothetical protein
MFDNLPVENDTSFAIMEPIAAFRQGQDIEDMLVPSCFASPDHMGRMPCYIKSFRRDPARYDLFCQFLKMDARLAMYAALPLYFANCMREPRLDKARRVAEILYDIDSPLIYEIICSKLSNSIMHRDRGCQQVGDFFEGLIEVMKQDDWKERDLEHIGFDDMNRLLVSIAERSTCGLDTGRLVVSQTVYDSHKRNGTLSSVLQFSKARLPRSLDRRRLLLRLIEE